MLSAADTIKERDGVGKAQLTIDSHVNASATNFGINSVSERWKVIESEPQNGHNKEGNDHVYRTLSCQVTKRRDRHKQNGNRTHSSFSTAIVQADLTHPSTHSRRLRVHRQSTYTYTIQQVADGRRKYHVATFWSLVVGAVPYGSRLGLISGALALE